MTPDEARALVDQIRGGLDQLRDAVVTLWQGQGWLALGYETWVDLCAAEFPFRLALAPAERRELVADLHQAGMSTRAIAPAVGVSHHTAARDVERLSHDETVGRPAKVMSLDGRERPATQPPRPAPTSEGAEFLDDFIDRDADLKRREQVRKFHQDLERSWALQKWDPEFVGTILEDAHITTIDHLIENLITFRDRVKAVRRAPLAVVKEMNR